MSTKREIEISDAWGIAKSKLAFINDASLMEASALPLNGRGSGFITKNGAYGRCYMLDEILDLMDEVIEAPHLREVS